MAKVPARLRHLVLVLGDQLDRESAALVDLDPKRDAVWMVEVAEESRHVWSHKARIAVFLSAMRHFRDELVGRGIPVLYRQLDDPENKGSFADELRHAIEKHKPEKLIVVEPGEWRVREALLAVAKEVGLELEIRQDTHFLSSVEDFREHAKGRKSLRMEFFYREMRRRHEVLLEPNGSPVGGDWNYDKANRKSFGKSGPQDLPLPPSFKPDAITRGVIDLVNERFAKHPGSLDHFDWPVTPADAEKALEDFLFRRLPNFGKYQDAMWTGEPFLNHSLLSAAMNLKLIHPLKIVRRAEEEYREGRVPLAAAEGFIRQILGWREYVRGIYWLHMPEYVERNALKAKRDLPDYYWTGDTEMQCLRQVIGQTLKHGYAHHIQRLMVTGLYALLAGVDPRQVHEWYLAVYVDAVEWVELPNTLGMSQFADGGVMASKPYAASGKYIQRMSNYCSGCRFDPAKRTGENACPFTTLYWDFLLRHEEVLKQNQRMSMQVRNLDRLKPVEKEAIREAAARHLPT